MKFNSNFFNIFFVLLFSYRFEAKTAVFDVTKYGAKPSEIKDINQELLQAWKDACVSTKAATKKVLIPPSTFALREIELVGPCKGIMVMDLEGTLKAPVNPSEQSGDYWVTFRNLEKLKLYGGGTFDGNGKIAWTKNNCASNPNCKNLPMNLRFDYVNNSVVEAIHSFDSKSFHINVLGCNNVTFKKLTIRAPGDSPNTDGIHIGRSTAINIFDTLIQTGDDCISIGDGSKQIKMTGIQCGPGHGISVGSLGKYENEWPVEGIYVKQCIFKNTLNGVRIKTWPGMYKSIATNMHFDDITMDNVENPIVIDQMYCPSGHCNMKSQSNVKLAKISFKNIRGTASTPNAIQLICSNQLPCDEVEMSDIHITYKGPQGLPKAQCQNVRPKVLGNVFPEGCKS